MRVSEIMSTDVRTVSPQEDAQHAWTLMRGAGIHHLIVLDGNAITGVVSERDLGVRRGPQRERVIDVMSRDVVMVSADTPVKRAANLLRGRSIGCLPVVDGNKLVGIVTVTDLLEVIGRGLEKPSARGTRHTLTHSNRTFEPRR